MLESLHLKNIGPAPTMELALAPRLNLLTGDNGLGKSFLLDVAWWALTRTWAGPIALPTTSKRASIAYVGHGKRGAARPVVSTFRRETQTWPVDAGRPPMPGIVVYVRIDGGFSVWDPARNYWRNDPSRPAAYHFTAKDVWEGLDMAGQRVCEGLERDWVNWQEARKPQFQALEEVLRILSPESESLRAGPPRRVFLGEGLLTAVDALRGTRDSEPQLLITTHAPLILASLEPLFDPDLDELFHLNLQDGRIVVESGLWAKQGDAANWLVSDVFGLEQPRSLEAERAIEAGASVTGAGMLRCSIRREAQ